MDENGVVPIVPIVECIGIIDNNTAVSLMNAVNQHIYSTQNLSKVQIHFSSPGGELWASIALYNYIRSLPVPTRIVNIGAIGSAAVLIYLAADERFAAKNSIFMLHNLIYIFTPEIKNMEYSQMAFQMKSITDDTKAYIDIYNERTSGAKKQLDIEEVMKGPIIRITPEQAVECGMANQVISAENLRNIDTK